jgi:beta-galactosidase
MWLSLESDRAPKRREFLSLLASFLTFLASMIAGAGAEVPAARTALLLDGPWQIDETNAQDELPRAFRHSVAVPGLVNLARPAFADVDQFESQELIASNIRRGRLPESARIHTPGLTRQTRNYFWYRKTFRAPSARAVALLQIGKAQFGTAVWLNGTKLSEYSGCFSASHFDLTDAIHWGASNELTVRIGAHPGVLPVTFPAGTDFEKLKWTPGIYDSVWVYFADNPVIANVQVAPRLSPPAITVQTRLKNYGPACETVLRHRVEPWKYNARSNLAAALPNPVAGNPEVPETQPLKVHFQAGEERVLTQTIPIPNARLWSPEDPFLYLLESRTGGDSLTTRFGVREFRGDAKTGRFYLNGKAYYLRGSNITLHRFFEDPDCGDRPWNDWWTRKLLAEIPKQMHWNSFRLCIGPVPDHWLEIADETGLLLQNEFFVWTGAPSWDTNYARHWDAPELIRQYGDWMRDGANHPSVAIWDANNETLDPVFGEKIIPAVRSLDLSNRPWENSYNPPAAPDDPIEYHPYLYQPSASGNEIKFHLADLEHMDGRPSAWHLPREPHPILINEYGWLWLRRDGSPTLLTDTLYPRLLGANATPDERFALNAYTLAAKTEFWRSSRHYAGVLHFVYLTCSYPGVFTSDHFLDVKGLRLEPHFADYLGEAFKPLGLCLNFFQPALTPGSSRSFTVKMVNDQQEPVQGDLALALVNDRNIEVARATQRFQIAELGAVALDLSLAIPSAKGKHVLKAIATPDGSGKPSPTVSRRWVTLE